MFDIGLLELFLIAVVSILVLGPEKLPVAVRSIAKTFYWFKKQTSDAKEEMNKAFDLNEVYQDSRNEEILNEIREQKD
tara:strand:+ start:205 stop:438 length:234 start_codon:yes stop_codon:yes gene_type:complete